MGCPVLARDANVVAAAALRVGVMIFPDAEARASAPGAGEAEDVDDASIKNEHHVMTRRYLIG